MGLTFILFCEKQSLCRRLSKSPMKICIVTICDGRLPQYKTSSLSVTLNNQISVFVNICTAHYCNISTALPFHSCGAGGGGAGRSKHAIKENKVLGYLLINGLVRTQTLEPTPLHYWLRRSMGFEKYKKWTKVDTCFSLNNPTKQKI